jgi:hypothetical protein
MSSSFGAERCDQPRGFRVGWSEGLGYPVFPVSRFSSAMGHSDDFNSVATFPIDHVEREAMENITTRAKNILRPHFWVFSYRFDSRI